MAGKRTPPSLGGKMTNWSKNVGRSVKYSAIEILKELAPNVVDTGSNASETLREVVKDLREMKVTQNKIRQQLETMPVYREGKNAIRNMKRDALSGKLNNKERLDRIAAADAGFGDDDFDFDMGDADMEFSPSSEGEESFASDVAEGVEPSVKSLQPGIAMTANATKHSAIALGSIAEGQQKQTDAIIATAGVQIETSKQIALTDMQMSQKMHGESMNVFNSMNDNMSKLVAFNDETISKLAMGSLQFYEDQLAVSRDILTEVRRLADKVAPAKEEEEEEEEKMLGWNDVFNSKGVMKFGKYGQLVKQNFNAALDNNSILSMLKMFTDEDALKSMAANPLGFISTKIASNLIPEMIKTSMKTFDQAVANFFPSLIMKINEGKSSGNPLKELLGDILGIDLSLESGPDFSKYEKGAVPWDGTSHKTLNVVIPEYLSGILATLRNDSQMAFDYEKGTFTTKQAMAKQMEEEEFNAKLSGASKSLNEIQKRLDTIAFKDPKEKEELFKALKEGFASSVDQTIMFKPENFDKLGLNNKYGKYIEAAMESWGRNNWMALNNASAKGAVAYNQLLQGADATKMMNMSQVRAGNVYDTHMVTGWDQRDPDAAISEKDLRDTKQALYEHEKNQVELLRDIKDVLIDGIITYPAYGSGGTGVPTPGTIDPAIAERRTKQQNIRKKVNEHYEEIAKSREKEIYTDEEFKDMTEGENAKYTSSSAFDAIKGSDRQAVLSRAEMMSQGILKNSSKAKDPNKMGGAYEELDKWVNETTFSKKIVDIKDAIQKFFESPSKLISSAMNKMTETMTTIIYGDPDDPSKSIIGIAQARIKETFDKFNDWLAKKYGDAKNFLFGEGGLTETKAYKWVKEKTSSIIDLVFGKKGENGSRSGGAFSDAFNVLSDGFFQVRNELFGTSYIDSKGKKINENTNSVFHEFKNFMGSAFEQMNSYLFGEPEKDKNGNKISFLDKITNTLGTGFNNFSNAIFGTKFSEEEGQATFKEFTEDFKKKLPRSLAYGVVGAGVGTAVMLGAGGILGSLFLPGGPIGGALLGTAVGFVTQSEKFKTFMFGKVGADGKRMGGIISRGVMDWVTTHKTALLGGATFGALKGIVGSLGVFNALGPLGYAANFLLPGGPIGGALLGAAVGIGWKSKVFQEFLYGKEGQDGKKVGGILNSQYSASFKKYLPNVAFGALAGGVGAATIGSIGILGAALAPGGIIGGALLGSALGIGLTSEKFKKFMFGERDDDGNLKKAGIFQRMGRLFEFSIIEPFKLKLAEISNGVEHWFRESISIPFEKAMIPLKNNFKMMTDELKSMFKAGWKFMTDKIDKVFVEAVGLPLGKFMEEKVLKPLRSFLGTLVTGIGKVFGSVLSSPVKALTVMTGAMTQRYDEKGIKDSRKERWGNFRSSFKSIFNPEEPAEGEERKGFWDRLKSAGSSLSAAVTQYGSETTKKDSDRYHTAEMKEEEAEANRIAEEKLAEEEARWKAREKEIELERDALKYAREELAKNNFATTGDAVKHYKEMMREKYGLPQVAPKDDVGKPATDTGDKSEAKSETSSNEEAGKPATGTGTKEETNTSNLANEVTGQNEKKEETPTEEKPTPTNIANRIYEVGEDTFFIPLRTEMENAQKTRLDTFNVLDSMKEILNNTFSLQRAMAYRQTGNKNLLDYEGNIANLSLTADEKAVMDNITAAAKDPKTGEVKKDAGTIAEEREEEKHEKNQQLIAEAQAKEAEAKELAEKTKGMPVPETPAPGSVSTTQQAGAPALSQEDRKFDQEKGVSKGGGDLATKYLRIIAQSVDGQLDGVGSNVYKSRKLLQIIAGASDEDMTGSANKDRVGFFGKMRRAVFDLVTNPFKFIGGIIKKPFEIVGNVLTKVTNTLGGIVKGIGSMIKGVGETLWDTAKKMGSFVLELPGHVLDFVAGVGSVIKETAIAGVQVIGEGLVGITKGAFAVIEGAAKGVGSVINGLGKGIGFMFDGLGKLSKSIFEGIGKGLKGAVDVIGATAKAGVEVFAGLTTAAADLTVEAMKGITAVGKTLLEGAVDLVTGTAKAIFSVAASPFKFLGKLADGIVSRSSHVIVDGGTLDRVKGVDVIELVRKIAGYGAPSPLGGLGKLKGRIGRVASKVTGAIDTVTGAAGKVVDAVTGSGKSEDKDESKAGKAEVKDEGPKAKKDENKEAGKPDTSSNVTSDMIRSGIAKSGENVKRDAATMNAIAEEQKERDFIVDNETRQTGALENIDNRGKKQEKWWSKLLKWALGLLPFLGGLVAELPGAIAGLLGPMFAGAISKLKDWIKSLIPDRPPIPKSLSGKPGSGANGKPGKSGTVAVEGKPGAIVESKPGANGKPGAKATGKPVIETKPTVGEVPKIGAPGEPVLLEAPKNITEVHGTITNQQGTFRAVTYEQNGKMYNAIQRMAESGQWSNVEARAVEEAGTIAADTTKTITVEAGETSATQCGKIRQLIQSGLEFIDKAASKLLGREVTAATNFGKKILEKLTVEVIKKNLPKFLAGIAKGVTGSVPVFGTGLNVLVAAWNSVSAYQDAAFMFKVKESAVTPAMRTVAVLMKTIMGSWYIPCVVLNIALMIYGAIVGIDHYSWLAEGLFRLFADDRENARLDEAQADFKKMAIEAGYTKEVKDELGNAVLDENGNVVTEADVDAYNKEVNKTLGDKVVDTTKALWSDYKNYVGKLYDEIGVAAFIPSIQLAAYGIDKFAESNVGKWFIEKKDAFADSVVKGWNSLKTSVGGIIDKISNFSLFGEDSEQIVTEDGTVVEQPGEPGLIDAASEFFFGKNDENGNYVPGLFADAKSWFGDKVVSAVEKATGFSREDIMKYGAGSAVLASISGQSLERSSNVLDIIGDKIQTIKQGFIDFGGFVVDYFGDAIKETWDGVTEFGGMLKKAFVDPVVDFASDFAEFTKNYFKESITKAIDGLTKFGEMLDKHFIGPVKESYVDPFVTGISDFVTFAIDEFKSGFNKAIDGVKEFGDMIKTHFVDPIADTISNVVDGITSVFKGFGAGVKNALGDFGRMISLGARILVSNASDAIFNLIDDKERPLNEYDRQIRSEYDELVRKGIGGSFWEGATAEFKGAGSGDRVSMGDLEGDSYGSYGTYDAAGCAPTVLTNIAREVTGMNIDPHDVGNAMVVSGDRIPGGTLESAFSGEVAHAFGLESYKANSLSEVADMIQSGMKVAVGGKGKDYTQAGHYMEVNGIGPDGVNVYDPTGSGRNKTIPLDDFANQTVTAYGFTGAGVGDELGGIISNMTMPDLSNIGASINGEGDPLVSYTLQQLATWITADNGPFGTLKSLLAFGITKLGNWLFGGEMNPVDSMVSIAKAGVGAAFGNFFGDMKKSLTDKWNGLKDWLFGDSNLSKENVFEAFKSGLKNAAESLGKAKDYVVDKAVGAKNWVKNKLGFGGSGEGDEYRVYKFKGSGQEGLPRNHINTAFRGKGGFIGAGNKMFMHAQTSDECTRQAAAALYNAYTGENTGAGSWHGWYNSLLSWGATPQGFSASQQTEFDNYVGQHFAQHPDYPLYLYQTGGAGHGQHPLNRGSGNHATVIGRKLSDGTYEIYDSNGGVVHKLQLNQIFDPTASGSSKNGTNAGEANLILTPTKAPSSPITEWGAENGASDGKTASGSEAGYTPTGGASSGVNSNSSSGGSDSQDGIMGVLGVFGSLISSAANGKVYVPGASNSSGNNSSKGSSGSGVVPTGEMDHKKVWDWLISEGYTKEAAAGIMGPWEHESHIQPKRVEADYLPGFPGYDEIATNTSARNNWANVIDRKTPGGVALEYYKGDDGSYYPGLGLAQWTGPRGQALIEFANSHNGKWYDMGIQVAYFNKEMEEGTRQGASKDDMNRASSVDEATNIFTRYYEGNTVPSYFPPRRASAHEIYNKFAGSGKGDNFVGAGPNWLGLGAALFMGHQQYRQQKAIAKQQYETKVRKEKETQDKRKALLAAIEKDPSQANIDAAVKEFNMKFDALGNVLGIHIPQELLITGTESNDEKYTKQRKQIIGYLNYQYDLTGAKKGLNGPSLLSGLKDNASGEQIGQISKAMKLEFDGFGNVKGMHIPDEILIKGGETDVDKYKKQLEQIRHYYDYKYYSADDAKSVAEFSKNKAKAIADAQKKTSKRSFWDIIGGSFLRGMQMGQQNRNNSPLGGRNSIGGIPILNFLGMGETEKKYPSLLETLNYMRRKHGKEEIPAIAKYLGKKTDTSKGIQVGPVMQQALDNFKGGEYFNAPHMVTDAAKAYAQGKGDLFEVAKSIGFTTIPEENTPLTAEMQMLLGFREYSPIRTWANYEVESSLWQTRGMTSVESWVKNNAEMQKLLPEKKPELSILGRVGDEIKFRGALEEMRKASEAKKEKDYSDIWNKMTDLLQAIANNTNGLDKSLSNLGKGPAAKTIFFPMQGGNNGATQKVKDLSMAGAQSPDAGRNAEIAAGGNFKR